MHPLSPIPPGLLLAALVLVPTSCHIHIGSHPRARFQECRDFAVPHRADRLVGATVTIRAVNGSITVEERGGIDEIQVRARLKAVTAERARRGPGRGGGGGTGAGGDPTLLARGEAQIQRRLQPPRGPPPPPPKWTWPRATGALTLRGLVGPARLETSNGRPDGRGPPGPDPGPDEQRPDPGGRSHRPDRGQDEQRGRGRTAGPHRPGPGPDPHLQRPGGPRPGILLRRPP